MKLLRLLVLSPLLIAFLSCRAAPQDADDDRSVGSAADGGVIVATGQLLHPAGKSIEFHGRPVDIVLSPDGKTAYVKSDFSVFVIDVAADRVRQELKYPEKT